MKLRCWHNRYTVQSYYFCMKSLKSKCQYGPLFWWFGQVLTTSPLCHWQLDNLRIEFGAGDCVLSPFKRTMTGVCNNPDNPHWGTPLTVLRRMGVNDPAYKDGMTSPSGTNVSARLISNVLCSETNSTEGDWKRRREHFLRQHLCKTHAMKMLIYCCTLCIVSKFSLIGNKQKTSSINEP